MLVKHKTYQRQNLFLVFFVFSLILVLMMGRLGYLMIYRADYYGVLAKELHERERAIKAERGKILDRNGNLLAGNVSVSTISVIHSQIKEPEKVISVLSAELGIDAETIRKKVEKVSSREKIKSNVEKEISDKIRGYRLAGVTVDEDYKRYYEHGSLASKVLGFTGGDNQGIIGLEVSYEKYLKGIDGSILTMATAGGTEIKNGAEDRVEPVAGWTLTTSLDLNVMEYANQVAYTLLEQKQAKTVEIIIMNPQNGEIYAMVNAPEFDLNNPYELSGGDAGLSDKQKMDKLNNQWRNLAVSDTYEPGSTFKVITAAAALDQGVVKMTDTFSCPGYKIVEDRRIRCHKTTGHGHETFLQGIMNSCNPVFMEVGARVGVSGMFEHMKRFGVMDKTGIDVPGEAGTIMHKQENVGAVELATMSFGQSFQLSPIRMMTSVSQIINGGKKIVPHFGISAVNSDGTAMKKFSYDEGEEILSGEKSKELCEALGHVVTEGGGKKAAVDGYLVGAKTGTSQKLPRGNGKYIASCIGFSPVENPQVIAMVRIDEPQGLYYGGTIAAPAISSIYTNILPYLFEE
ncbi:MAG: penicillin-binding transpeptidase domain-containing protein [Roseburia sp.]|nr:penicillin-binding transpeptidase domain-containing protein [Roseburia sp.]